VRRVLDGKCLTDLNETLSQIDCDLGRALTYTQRLWRVEIAALCALVAVAIFIGVWLAVQTLYLSEANSGVFATIFVGTTLTFSVALLPVVFYGAPIYAWYIYGGNLPRWLLYVLAAVPGFMLAMFGVGFVGIVAGIMIAGMLEILSVKWPGLAKRETG